MKKSWMPILALILFLTACSPDDMKDAREERARAADKNTPIAIGFVWPFSAEYDLLPEGVEMALAEINAGGLDKGKEISLSLVADDRSAYQEGLLGGMMLRPETSSSGGLLGGRKIQLVRADDLDSVREGRLIAQEFAENIDLTAVIGHAWSYISVPSAPIYEFNGLIMLSPSSTSPDLTRNNFQYIFRNLASDTEVGRQLALYANSQGYRRLLLLHADDPNGRQLANVLENEADKLEMLIVDRQSYTVGSVRSFRSILNGWSDLEFDAIFIAGSNPEAAAFVAQARAAWPDVPILGSDGMDTSDLADIAGENGEGVIVASHYHIDNPRSEQQDFIQRFEALYGVPPDTWAAQGYDAVYLLAYAIEQAGSTIPSEVALALHTTQGWPGVTGPHTFADSGDVIDKPIILKILRDNELQFLQVADVSDSPVFEVTPEAGE